MKLLKKCGISNAMDDAEDDFNYESVDEKSSYSEYHFYDEEATRLEFKKLFGDSDSDSEFEGIA